MKYIPDQQLTRNSQTEFSQDLGCITNACNYMYSNLLIKIQALFTLETKLKSDLINNTVVFIQGQYKECSEYVAC